MRIPKSLYVNDTVHRSLTNDSVNGTLSCGFLVKPNSGYTERDLIFKNYGALILLDGSGTYSDAAGYQFTLNPGAYVQRLPGRPHTTIVNSTGNWLEFFVCFGKSTYETLLSLNLITDTPVIFPGTDPQILTKCIYLLECFKKLPDEQLPMLYTYAQNWVMDMYSSSKYNGLDYTGHENMKKACDLLYQMTPEFFTGAEIAEQIHMNYESFRKKFKFIYGISPLSYQLNYRINYAKSLLLDTTKSVNEIALICHFADAFAFSKAFKNRCKISPNDFRKNHLNL